MIAQAAEIAVAVLLVIGGLFAVVGSWGLLRLKDRMQRLHAPTKATTVGVGTALIALVLAIWLREGRFSGREVLVAVFFFATAPLSALFLAKAHLFLSVPRKEVPPAGPGKDWATFAPDTPANDGADR
jgi:multicomponent K+:H+ antiporter subunit G